MVISVVVLHSSRYAKEVVHNRYTHTHTHTHREREREREREKERERERMIE